MTLSILRSLAPQARIVTLAVTAFLGLTGAKGGCGGTVVTPEPLPTPCEVGFKPVEVCAPTILEQGCPEGSDCPSFYGTSGEPICEVQCVPEPACEPGFHLEQVCGGVSPPCPEGADCVAPAVVDCFDQCVPDAPCGPGFHLETLCDPVVQGMPDCPPDTDCAEPPPSCFDQCVPDAVCPPGQHPETYCPGCPDGEVCAAVCEIACVEDSDCGHDDEPTPVPSEEAP